MVVRQNDGTRAVYFLLSGAVHILVHFEGVGDLLMGAQREPRWRASPRVSGRSKSRRSRASPGSGPPVCRAA